MFHYILLTLLHVTGNLRPDSRCSQVRHTPMAFRVRVRFYQYSGGLEVKIQCDVLTNCSCTCRPDCDHFWCCCISVQSSEHVFHYSFRCLPQAATLITSLFSISCLNKRTSFLKLTIYASSHYLILLL